MEYSYICDDSNSIQGVVKEVYMPVFVWLMH